MRLFLLTFLLLFLSLTLNAQNAKSVQIGLGVGVDQSNTSTTPVSSVNTKNNTLNIEDVLYEKVLVLNNGSIALSRYTISKIRKIYTNPSKKDILPDVDYNLLTLDKKDYYLSESQLDAILFQISNETKVK